MTLVKRISIVRTLTIIQMAIPLFFLAIGAAFFLFLAFGGAQEMPPLPAMVLGAVLFLIALAATIGLPWIVLNAIKVRKENWATAAFVSLIVQIVCGGGALSLLPIISLVLLLDKEASAYIGMK
ncbi:MAG: hypothetical protein AAB473_02625 [Patescibacteria group bacterium]